MVAFSELPGLPPRKRFRMQDGDLPVSSKILHIESENRANTVRLHNGHKPGIVRVLA
jgi:hypothetical protein